MFVKLRHICDITWMRNSESLDLKLISGTWTYCREKMNLICLLLEICWIGWLQNWNTEVVEKMKDYMQLNGFAGVRPKITELVHHNLSIWVTSFVFPGLTVLCWWISHSHAFVSIVFNDYCSYESISYLPALIFIVLMWNLVLVYMFFLYCCLLYFIDLLNVFV